MTLLIHNAIHYKELGLWFFWLLPWPALQTHWVVRLLNVIKSRTSIAIFSPCLLDPFSRGLLKNREPMWLPGPTSVTTCSSPFAHHFPPFSFHPKSLLFITCSTYFLLFCNKLWCLIVRFFKGNLNCTALRWKNSRTVSMKYLLVTTAFL